jgi:hypothetical protein
MPLTADVLHAPTPTAERLTLPARLIATVPVDSSRRHVHPGPAMELVLGAAAQAYPQLAAALAPDQRTVLVPPPGFPASEVDAALREAVLEALRHTPWLPSAAGDDIAPAHALVLDVPLPDLGELLADVIPDLLDAELAGAAHTAALAALGVTRLRPAAIADLLAGLDRPPSWWRRCYAALFGLLDADPSAREELGALPVPLADGRTVTGPRGVLLGDLVDVAGGVPTELRLVHPDAAHPLLERLGARPVGPAELLDALRPAIERSVDDAEDGLDVTGLARAVLSLAATAASDNVSRPWLGALALPDDTGAPRRADELVLPGGAVRDLLAPDAPLGVLDAAVAAEQPGDALRAVGVLDSFAVLDEPHPDGPDHDLDDEQQWWAQAHGADGEPPARLLAVRDLDLVDDQCWPIALRRIAADPAGLAALRQPGGYTGWWLARHARLGGHPPPYWRLAGAVALEGLYDVVPVCDTGEALLAAAGVRTGLSIGGAADAADLLARLGDPTRTVTPAVVHAAHTALAGADLRRGWPGCSGLASWSPVATPVPWPTCWTCRWPLSGGCPSCWTLSRGQRCGGLIWWRWWRSALPPGSPFQKERYSCTSSCWYVTMAPSIRSPSGSPRMAPSTPLTQYAPRCSYTRRWRPVSYRLRSTFDISCARRNRSNTCCKSVRKRSMSAVRVVISRANV